MLDKELENAKKSYKGTIQELINSNKILEAKYMIDEYEKRINDDIEMFSIKSVVYILLGKLFAAESTVNDGLKLDSNNFDLVYNKAYIYELRGSIKKAVKFYTAALKLSDSDETANKIRQIIENLKDKKVKKSKKKKVLIGSPVHQKPEILNEFLISLKELNSEKFELAFIFVDDNEISESHDILSKFSDEVENVIIYKSNKISGYVCDEETHHWNENLIWKVAEFKDKIINKAIEFDFDYLFLVDSDMVIHPETINQLMSTKKDVISNIFWTKWENGDEDSPQVWLFDQYNQYFKARNESLTNEEIYMRYLQFINMLKAPGVYEVGGLCACTLLSKKALKAGVRFHEIKNISFVGEDRHFCIRAEALGFNLYVDTHYPAYHIYREEDLNGVKKFKERCQKGECCLNKKISLVYTNFSGCNTLALFKLMPDYIKEKYNVQLIEQNLNNEYVKTLMNSDLVVVTEGNYFLNKKSFNTNQKVIDLFHGFPLKAMGYADKQEIFKDNIESVWDNVDYVTSYSKPFNGLMSKCFNISSDKYVITGYPRNDFLYKSKGRINLENILNKKINNKKVIFYMPTYRYTPRGNRVEGGRKWNNNIFDFENFDQREFSEFLEKNNLILVLKMHPAEELVMKKYVKEDSNILMVTDQLFQNNNIDFYEVLNGIDLLITDYSSVYFDYLLLDRPIIFTPTDLEEYDKKRGFMLKPYEKWTPGPKVLKQQDLQNEILKCFGNNSYYRKERNEVLNFVHENLDGNSSQRVWSFIDKMLENQYVNNKH